MQKGIIHEKRLQEGEEAREKGHVRTWGRGVKQGRTSTSGKKMEYGIVWWWKNDKVGKAFWREKNF